MIEIKIRKGSNHTIFESVALQELGVKEAEVFGDLTLVIAQARRLWKAKEEHLKSYQQYL